MNRGSRWFATAAAVIFSATAFLNLYALAGRQHTFTGEVGDAMCGRKHMEGDRRPSAPAPAWRTDPSTPSS
jgi:hypothetical protein